MPVPLKSSAQEGGVSSSEVIQGNTASKRTEPTIEQGPAVPTGRTLAQPFSSETPPTLKGDKISINFDGIALPAFVNTVFGELLKVTFEIDDAVAKKNQLVTLRTAEPMTPDAFFHLVSDVLRNYGVSVVYQNNVYRIVESASIKQEVPTIIRSRAVPNIPSDMRPIFQFVQLKNVEASLVLIWLDMALKDRVKFQGVNYANGILIMGRPEDVKAALETIDVLDQPSMAGTTATKITPAYWSAEKLAQQLQIVLQAEGYSTAVGPNGAIAIKLVPIAALNTLIVFTQSQETMQHVMKWVRDLDQPGQTVNTQGVFYYQVQNTSAKELAEVLARIMGGGGPEPESNRQQQQQIGAGPAGASVPQANQTSQANSPTPSALIGNRRVTIDAARNAIIFQGTPEEFSQFRTLAVQMDRAPLEVLIEATIAEVTLTDNEDLGVTLTYDNGVNPVLNSSSVKSNEGLFVSLIRDRGAFLSNLTASANKNKVTILSSPRVVASSGKKANIKVGTQVPILTTQQTAATGAVNGTSTILQDVQYRDTGVLLTIDPVINSNRRVELDISQEVSEAGANKISDVASPTIFTRDIQTSLSLSDGETVLLGGLISENLSKGDNGIPFLKDVPVLGNLFKTTSKGRTRIELVVLLTPYIIDGTDTARAVRDAFVNELPSLPPIPMSTPLPQKH